MDYSSHGYRQRGTWVLERCLRPGRVPRVCHPWFITNVYSFTPSGSSPPYTLGQFRNTKTDVIFVIKY